VVSQYYGSSVEKIFDQYLRTTKVPVLEYSISADKKKLSYRYTNCVDGFNLPIWLPSTTGMLLLAPESNKWNEKELKGDPSSYDFASIEKGFYVVVKQVSN
jgi:hypothetical protein